MNSPGGSAALAGAGESSSSELADARAPQNSSCSARSAARVALAGETRKLFAAGETVAIHNDRVLVLASRTPELADRVAILGAALHTHGLLRHDPVSAWVERLPTDAADLRAFVEDLTA